MCRLVLLALLTFYWSSASAAEPDLSAAEPDLSAAVRDLITAGNTAVPPELQFLSELWSHLQPELLPPEQRDLACSACEAAVTAVIDLFLLGVETEEIEAGLESLCSLLGVMQPAVCHGGIRNYGPVVEWVILNRRPRITGSEVCGAVLGPGCGAWEEINRWEVELPGGKPPVVKPSPPPPDTQQLKVLHITDIHLDLTYTVGNSAECGLPMCCGNTSGPAVSGRAAAYWGDYQCDVPVHTFTQMLEHIRTTHQLDYIMISGDFPAHDVWLQSREHNLATATTVLQALQQVFPDTLVLPSLGNHEPFPCNIIPGSTAGTDGSPFDPGWLLGGLADLYAAWLPDQQLDMFRARAAYSYLVRPGLRLISFPSPLCLTYNFFLWMDWSDPGQMLQWLVEELYSAEQAGERVHLLSHVPSGNHECLGGWGREYSRIINRFEGTISGHFHGHTHNDEFAIYYDPANSSRATNVGFISPSVATFTGFNPGYRVYSLDSGHQEETFRVTDYQTWVFDLTAANSNGEGVEPAWYNLYSPAEDLGLGSLAPADWDTLGLCGVISIVLQPTVQCGGLRWRTTCTSGG